jgi:hypothetical protein
MEPGSRGVVRTTVTGSQVEEIPLTFLGTQENALGPGYDLHLVQLEGAVAERVGVAAGMSGSPVYMDGKLIGALAYRIGVMPEEAIGGVTPIEDILDAAKAPPPGAARAGTTASAIGTPVQVGALVGPVREWLHPQLQELGFVPLAGGGSGARASGTLGPGSPVGVEMVGGDLRIAASGTVTRIDGERVYAFGHSFFGDGRIEMPMIAADVIHTLADAAGSFKLTRFGPVVGAVTEDRLTSVIGYTGRRAKTVPVRLDVSGADYGERTFRFELARHEALTPLFSGVVVANTLISDLGHDHEATMLATGRIRVSGGRELPLEFAAAGEGAADPALFIAASLQSTVQAIWSNPFEAVDVTAIELEVKVSPVAHRYTIESLQYDRGPLRPGEMLELDCVLRERRGESVTRRFHLEVPPGITASETLGLAVGDPAQTQRALGRPLEDRLRSVRDLEAMIGVLSERRSDHRLTAVLVRQAGGAISRGVEYGQLPPTAQRLLSSRSASGGGKQRRISLVSRQEIDLDGPVDGGLMIRLQVEPGVEIDEERR